MTGGKHSVGDKSKAQPSGHNQRTCDAGQRPTSKMPHMVTRLPITDLNQHLTCALCSGYMIDATTVVECLHSFCRSCLLRYLESSNTCPICDTQINKAQLDKCVRADHTLQDLVYKLVPGLYKSELRRRKDFYLEQCKSATDDTPSSSSKSDPIVPGGMQIFDKHLVELSAFICTPDEIISFSLETAPKKYQQPHSPSSGKNGAQTSSGTETSGSSDSKPASSPMQQPKAKDGKDLSPFKRYFRCPAAVTVGHLKKLLAHKLNLSSAHQVEILHSDEPLLDEYTLMDIAYIYTWRRKAPMQLFFNVCKYETEEEPMPLLEPEIATLSPSVVTAPKVPPAIATTSASPPSQEVKLDVTPAIISRPRLSDTSSSGKRKNSSTSDSKKDPAPSSHIGAVNGANHAVPTPVAVENSNRQSNSNVRTVLTAATVRPRRPSPVPAETSMRGKPPLPLDRGNDFLANSNKKTSPVVFNGKNTPIRLAFPHPSPSCNGKKKPKQDGDTPSKQSNPRKPKAPPKLVPTSPDILAALQKITGLVSAKSPPVHAPPAAPIIKPNIPPVSSPPTLISPPMNAISIDTQEKIFHSPTSSAQSSRSTSDEAGSPLLSPSGGAYQPTAAQSSCTQPAKLRLKKSLNSVVDKLLTSNMEACSPAKKMKLENGTEEHGTTMIH